MRRFIEASRNVDASLSRAAGEGEGEADEDRSILRPPVILAMLRRGNPQSRAARAPAPRRRFRARDMGGPERRGAVVCRGKRKVGRSRNVPDHGRLFCSPPPGPGSLPLSGHGSPRHPRTFRPAHASLSRGFRTKEGQNRRRGVARFWTRVAAHPREPRPADAPDPSGAPHAAEARRDIGIKSVFVKRLKIAFVRLAIRCGRFAPKKGHYGRD
jgi:hypothetical protein